MEKCIPVFGAGMSDSKKPVIILAILLWDRLSAVQD
jgi:hypothetical protein